jgi:hypothetical protein
LDFELETDNIPKEIWELEHFDNHPMWILIRLKANILLDKVGIQSRTYNDDLTTVYDSKGNILKKGKL